MADQLSARLGQLATRRNVLVLLALDLLMNAVVLPLAGARIQAFSGGVGPLDLRLSYSAADAYAALTAYGPAGREFYMLIELSADVIYPLIYSFFFSLAILFLWQHGAGRWPFLARLALVPFAGLAFDFLENICLVTLLLNYPARIDTVAGVAGLFTTLKWIAAALSLLVLFLSGAAAIMARRQTPGSTPP